MQAYVHNTSADSSYGAPEANKEALWVQHDLTAESACQYEFS